MPLVRYEDSVGFKRPKPMTHIVFRVSLVTQLGFPDAVDSDPPPPHHHPAPSWTPHKRWLCAGGVRQSNPCVTQEQCGGRVWFGPSATASGTHVFVRQTLVMHTHHTVPQNQVRVTPRLFAAKRLHTGGKRKYNINGAEAMNRFKGQQYIPGMYILMTVPKCKSFRCQVCRSVGTAGAYGPDKDLNSPPPV